ncbi:LysR family transcriptional regulator [Amycolatopsis orientalis]|uniref:LysR family transcriptional regulator n=1 Tax=Amycolatopsis orientalis TaxID=31958 RepID=A0A193BYG4_AMYOR|nr:LysR family transcriptional regulator [Amycolatopsis orientalis]ANN17209.1 LysR family transcriptional regulator [Amycolatopsis orientalis]
MHDLAQLRALHAVARNGSISGAADALHVTTSAISQRLAKLERDVGQQLLERHGRSVRLTDSAHLLVGYIDRILLLMGEAEASLEGQKGAVTGSLTIAAFPTAARGLVSGTLRSLRESYPHLRVEFTELEPEESLPRVVRGDVDIAVVQDWFTLPLQIPDVLMKEHLLDDITDVALPDGHPLATRETVELGELANDPWVTWSIGQMCHNWLLDTIREHGVQPRIAHTAAEYATQLALVAGGNGVAMIPRLGRDAIPPGVRIVGVEPVLSRQVFALWRNEAVRRPAIRAAVEALVTAARS